MKSPDEIALDDIDKFGCHILHVMQENEFPPFSYSIGITKKTGLPEVIVIGLKNELSLFIINEYNLRIKNGETFKIGSFYDDFIEGHKITFEAVDKSNYKEYFGWGIWLYKGYDFEVMQLIYPTTDGAWPWDPTAPTGYKIWQPLLSLNNEMA